MPLSVEELIEQLNIDLSLEYMAIVQYAQHGGVLSRTADPELRRQLAQLAAEELQHALTLAGEIARLGGTPTVRVLKARTSPDPVAMLRQDLRGEETAVERYGLRVRQAGALGLADLGRALREILAMEQEHRRCLLAALGEAQGSAQGS
jgi:bacterioferritin